MHNPHEGIVWRDTSPSAELSPRPRSRSPRGRCEAAVRRLVQRACRCKAGTCLTQFGHPEAVAAVVDARRRFKELPPTMRDIHLEIAVLGREAAAVSVATLARPDSEIMDVSDIASGEEVFQDSDVASSGDGHGTVFEDSDENQAPGLTKE